MRRVLPLVTRVYILTSPMQSAFAMSDTSWLITPQIFAEAPSRKSPRHTLTTRTHMHTRKKSMQRQGFGIEYPLFRK